MYHTILEKCESSVFPPTEKRTTNERTGALALPTNRTRRQGNVDFSKLNWLSSARLRAFLFNVELAYPGYLGFGVYLITYLLSSARLRAVLFNVELASPAIWILDFF